jgi:hypothetical protein
MDRGQKTWFVAELEPNKSSVDLEIRLWRRHLEKKSSGSALGGNSANLVHPSISWAIVGQGSLPHAAPLASLVQFFSEDSDPWIYELIDFINADIDDQGEKGAALALRSADPGVVDSVHAALEAIDRSLPAMGYLVRKLVRHVIVCKSQDFIGSSTPKALGAIVVAPTAQWTLALYIDTLVHEASHIELFVRQLCDPLVVGSVYLDSPLRNQQRPQIGVLHAAFVLARVCLALQAFSRCCQTPPAESSEAKFLLAQNHRFLAEAIIVLRNGASLTEAGKYLLTNIITLEKRLVSP